MTMPVRIAIALVALGAWACSSSSPPAVVTDSGGPVTCAWPTYLNPDSGMSGPESGLCTAYRYLFACTGPTEGMCVSAFPDAGMSPECAEQGPGYTCTTNKCNADEYVVFCNSFNATAPNSSCRELTADPEQQFFCCHCVSEGL